MTAMSILQAQKLHTKLTEMNRKREASRDPPNPLEDKDYTLMWRWLNLWDEGHDALVNIEGGTYDLTSPAIGRDAICKLVRSRTSFTSLTPFLTSGQLLKLDTVMALCRTCDVPLELNEEAWPTITVTFPSLVSRGDTDGLDVGTISFLPITSSSDPDTANRVASELSRFIYKSHAHTKIARRQTLCS